MPGGGVLLGPGFQLQHVPRRDVLGGERVRVRDMSGGPELGARGCRVLCVFSWRILAGGIEHLHRVRPGKLLGRKLRRVSLLPSRDMVGGGPCVKLRTMRGGPILGDYRRHKQPDVPGVPERHVFDRDGGRDVSGVHLVSSGQVFDARGDRVHRLPPEHVQLGVLWVMHGLPSILGLAGRGHAGAVCVQAWVCHESLRRNLYMHGVQRWAILGSDQRQPVHRVSYGQVR